MRFFLDLLDELNKFRHCIHAQQWEKPPIKLKGLLLAPFDNEIEKINRFAWERVDQAGNPTNRACLNSFHDGIVDAYKNGEPISDEGTNCRYSSHIGRGFLDCSKVGKLVGEVSDMFGNEVG